MLMIEARIIIKIPTSLGFFKEPNFVIVKKKKKGGTDSAAQAKQLVLSF
jgi:hypothetical protein